MNVWTETIAGCACSRKDCSTPMLRAYNADAGNCVHGGLSMDGAFDRLRRYSHNHLR